MLPLTTLTGLGMRRRIVDCITAECCGELKGRGFAVCEGEVLSDPRQERVAAGPSTKVIALGYFAQSECRRSALFEIGR